MNNELLIQQLDTASDKRIGMVTLNKENSLNALSLEMARDLKALLEQWREDDQIACVFLQGAGNKAFCAGGDIQQMYWSAVNSPELPQIAEQFFAYEYRLDYLLHTYPKPIICWGNGIVMGGGLGLFAGCSHAIVTETTRLAMPEITIGLYPDVGASWFLNRMPEKAGLFLGLTGVPINAADCLFVGLSEHMLLSTDRDALLSYLAESAWSDTDGQNAELINQLLANFKDKAQAQMPVANVQRNLAKINKLCDEEDVYEVINRIRLLETDNLWLAKARDTLAVGSPLSALIICRQLLSAKDFSLEEVFQFEYMLSTNILRYPEFTEGIRALLIDKDRNPQWQYKKIEEVPAEVLNQFFTPPHSGSTWPINPLADLA